MVDSTSHALVDRSFLALIDDAELSALETIGVRRSFARGSALMFEHEPGERVMVILSGRVKVSRITEGREVLLSIRDPGDLIGDLSFIDGEPRIATVTALERVEALVLPVRALRAHLEVTPRVAVAMLEVVTRRFRSTTVKRAQLSSSDTLGRVAARLTELATRYGSEAPDGITVISPLSIDELAAWTGASRAGVAQAMKTMRELGWLETDRRRIVIREPEALAERAG